MTADSFVVSRVINAPRRLVFKMWTDPKHRARWWRPSDLDDPPIGDVITEVVAPERIVIVTRDPGGEKHERPFDVINTITFEDLGRQTRLTVHARPEPRTVRGRRSRRRCDAFAAMTA